MATKAEERKALEQIRKIVSGLGEESYIGRAFEGCFEIAEGNIDNDFWNSPKEAVITTRENAEAAKKEAAELHEEIDAVKARYEKNIDELKAENSNLSEKIETLHHKVSEVTEMCNKNWNNFREQEDRAEALELENMKLKAKLYDMMVGA